MNYKQFLEYYMTQNNYNWDTVIRQKEIVKLILAFAPFGSKVRLMNTTDYVHVPNLGGYHQPDVDDLTVLSHSNFGNLPTHRHATFKDLTSGWTLNLEGYFRENEIVRKLPFRCSVRYLMKVSADNDPYSYLRTEEELDFYE